MKSSLRPSTLIIAARPTSLPVPAVVGIATVRATRAVIRSTPPFTAA